MSLELADVIMELPWLDDDTYDRLKASIDAAIAAAVAEEREACAKVCDRAASNEYVDSADFAAASIRARSSK